MSSKNRNGSKDAGIVAPTSARITDLESSIAQMSLERVEVDQKLHQRAEELRKAKNHYEQLRWRNKELVTASEIRDSLRVQTTTRAWCVAREGEAWESLVACQQRYNITRTHIGSLDKRIQAATSELMTLRLRSSP